MGVEVGRIHSSPRVVTRWRCGLSSKFFAHLLLIRTRTQDTIREFQKTNVPKRRRKCATAYKWKQPLGPKTEFVITSNPLPAENAVVGRRKVTVTQDHTQRIGSCSLRRWLRILGTRSRASFTDDARFIFRPVARPPPRPGITTEASASHRR